MARYPAGHKEETHQRIVEVAARLFRKHGYAASGVASIMEAAELTVGGFYAHFESKEALLGAALARSLEDIERAMLDGLSDVAGEPFVQEVARRYLSEAHRDSPEAGCAVPALAGEIARQSVETRQVFEAHVERMLGVFEPHIPDRPESGLGRRDWALAVAALFVGGLSLSRAVKSEALSNRILQACRVFLRAGVSAPAGRR